MKPDRTVPLVRDGGIPDIDLSVDAAPRRALYSEGDESTPQPEAGVPGAVMPRGGASAPGCASAASVPEANVAVSPQRVAEAERTAVQRARDHRQRLARRRRRHGNAEWMRRGLEDLPVCIIDLETTGGSGTQDDILEVGAVLLRGHDLVREFESLVDPERPISPAAQRVHGIAASDVDGCPTVRQLLPWIRELAERRVLLFHNAGFDLGFLQRAFTEAGQEPLRQPVIDSVVVAHRLLGGRCGLGALGQRLGIALAHRHRALADARLTAQVWLRLLTALEEAGATTLGEVPGVVGRAPVRPRRTRRRDGALATMIGDAVRQRRALEVAYRTAAGQEPHVRRVLPLAVLQHRVCRCVDLDRDAHDVLWLDRIDRCRLLDAGKPSLAPIATLMSNGADPVASAHRRGLPAACRGIPLKVLILGAGAREHALAEAVAASGRHPEVFVAPGNTGLRDVATCVDLGLGDVEALARWADEHCIDLTIAGSEEPLVQGAWDAFDARRLRLLGPSARAAQLEGSKVFAKQFMRRHGIPTADFVVCTSLAQAQAALQELDLPRVLKAEGLAAGKGVFVVSTFEECERALHELFVDGRFGDAAQRVLVEECLEGPEVSVFALCDGHSYRILGVAQDHKRAGDGNTGPNTGGMGAVSPVSWLTSQDMADIEIRVLAPTLVGMLEEGAPYRGFLYLGLMLTSRGPQVLEYNCRLGDPEAQVVLPRLRSDLLELVLAAEAGDVKQAPFELAPVTTVGVVVAAEGYPQAARLGRPVQGIDAARQAGARVFCAGVRDDEGVWVTSGGRVLTVVGEGEDVEAARRRAYEAVQRIRIPGSFHRRDIGALDPQGEAWKSRSSVS